LEAEMNKLDISRYVVASFFRSQIVFGWAKEAEMIEALMSMTGLTTIRRLVSEIFPRLAATRPQEN